MNIIHHISLSQIVRRVYLNIVCVVLAGLLIGCGGLVIEKTPLGEVADLPPPNNQPSPIGFQDIRFAIPTGSPTISQSPKGIFGLLKCDWPYQMVQTGIRGRSFPNDNFRELFLNTLEGQGYDVTGDPGRFFDELEDEMRTVYAVGGQIVDVKIDTCHQTNFWGIGRGFSGEASVAINWSVYDMLNRKKVFETKTKGYGNLGMANQEGIALLFEHAVEAAIHNLGTTRGFYDMVFYGVQPENPPKTIMDLNEEPMTLFDPREEVFLPARPVSTTPAKNRLSDIKKAAVMIEAGRSHGSGFFLTEEGHIMTNAHVVGNAVRVRVVTSGKKKKLKAEVLRVDRRRDVALLKLEEIPEKLKIVTLPIRLDKPEIGEDIYAIGAPQRKQLQDTVTHGIISAHRYSRREKQYYIQGDVDIYGGNSGGPLIDANGNVVGLSVLGFFVSPGTMGGLNWFVPIRDGLEKLDISVKSR